MPRLILKLIQAKVKGFFSPYMSHHSLSDWFEINRLRANHNPKELKYMLNETIVTLEHRLVELQACVNHLKDAADLLESDDISQEVADIAEQILQSLQQQDTLTHA